MTQGAMEAPAVQGGLALATVSWLTHYGHGRIAPHPKKKKNDWEELWACEPGWAHGLGGTLELAQGLEPSLGSSQGLEWMCVCVAQNTHNSSNINGKDPLFDPTRAGRKGRL